MTSALPPIKSCLVVDFDSPSQVTSAIRRAVLEVKLSYCCIFYVFRHRQTLSVRSVRVLLSMREVWGSNPGRSNQTQCRQRLVPAAMFFGAVLPRR